MDYSKLTPEQLLEMLKTQSPDMYSALTEPISSPGYWSDGENPMDYYSDSMSDVLGRGYDPNLIVDRALNNYYLQDETDQNNILFTLDQIGTGLANPDNSFPSDSYDPSVNYLIGDDDPFYSDLPAFQSARAILANNRQIGDSDYTIDNLRATGMSDEQLLEFLRTLTNKGYKI